MKEMSKQSVAAMIEHHRGLVAAGEASVIEEGNALRELTEVDITTMDELRQLAAYACTMQIVVWAAAHDQHAGLLYRICSLLDITN